MTITSQEIVITPELARKLLEKNFSNNRTIRSNLISKYATAMKNDEWCISEPIKIDEDGQLIDGQHRLTAVVKADCPIRFLVCQNYPSESAQFLDIGARRTAADVGAIRGLEVKSHQVATTRALFFQNQKFFTQRITIPEKTILDTYLEYQDYVDFGVSMKKNTAVYSAPIAATFARAAYHYENIVPNNENLDKLVEGMNTMITGHSNTPGNPLIVLRDYCMTNKGTTKTGKANKTRYSDYYLSLYMTDKQRVNLAMPKVTPYVMVYNIDDLDIIIDQHK